MKATRTKRMADLTGLLMALALSATACSGPMGSGSGNGAAAPVAEVTQAPKLSSMPLREDGDFEGWNSMDGETDFKWSEADKASMQKNGSAILEILTQRHPEFTVEGFNPTPEVWESTVAPELKALTVSSAWPQLTKNWMKEVPAEDGEISGDGTVPYEMRSFLTNRPEIMDFAEHPMYKIIRSWKSPAGEKCSPSDKPYDVTPVAISATTRPEGNSFASAYPLITANLDVTIHCKEGGRLKVEQMTVTLQLKKEKNEWLLNRVNMFAPSTPNVMEK